MPGSESNFGADSERIGPIGSYSGRNGPQLIDEHAWVL